MNKGGSTWCQGWAAAPPCRWKSMSHIFKVFCPPKIRFLAPPLVMNPAGDEAVPSPLDKPLGELTEDDIAQLTREDCRRFLKQKGMRRPSWNKSQAIQQVISLKALLDSRSDSGDGARTKTLHSPPRAAVTSPQARVSAPEPSPYRRRDPNPIPPAPFQLTCGSHVTSSADVSASVVPNLLGGQMTIFYGGRVSVYNDVPAEKAQVLMQLAAIPDRCDMAPGLAYPNRLPLQIPGKLVPNLNFPPCPLQIPGKLVPNLNFRENVDWSVTRETEPEGPTSRQASLQRYRDKRKDRYKGKKVTGGSSSPNMEMMYLSQKFSCQIPCEQASQNDTSSPTQPRPPLTPTRCTSTEKQSQKLCISMNLNGDGGGN